MDVAVAGVNTGVFEERLGNVHQLEFAASARLIYWQSQILRPGKYRGDIDLMGCPARNWNVLSIMPVVCRIWL